MLCGCIQVVIDRICSDLINSDLSRLTREKTCLRSLQKKCRLTIIEPGLVPNSDGIPEINLKKKLNHKKSRLN